MKNKKFIEITSVNELNKIGSDNNYPNNGNYKLMNDIDLSDLTIELPLPEFSGIFDGCNKTIKNISFVDTYNKKFIGLFRSISKNGKVKNLNIDNFEFIDILNPGIITPYNQGLISNCKITNSKILFEYKQKSDQYNYFSEYGIISGINLGKIDKCELEDIEINGISYIGFICGSNYGIVSNCSINDGSLHGDEYIGGICGYNYNTIKKCIIKNIELYKCKKYVGGICGYNRKNINDCEFINISIDGCEKFYDKICGYNLGSIKHCIYNDDFLERTEY